MSFVSFSFILLFGVFTVLYFVLPHKCQWPMLLIFSYAFYWFAAEKLPIYMVVTTVVTFFSAFLIDSINCKSDNYIKENKETISRQEKKELKNKAKKKGRTILVVALILNFGMLAVFKYSDFVVGNITGLLAHFGIETGYTGFNLLLPLGISFYTFQSTGYIIDVYRGKVKAEKNPLKLALFVSYFPQIIEGPIGRFGDLHTQLISEHKFSFDRLKRNILLILWGFLKKLVIADNLALTVNEVSGNYAIYDGFQLFVCMILYGIQLYTDFSGYMDMASGFSGILGIELAQNFKRPYFSTSLAEFWRRWHITLCAWFRDYLFYPIYMSKKCMGISKKLRKKGHKKAATIIPTFIATVIVWFLTGLWHGAYWTEIVWGLCNGLIMMFSLQFKDGYEKVNRRLHINEESKIWTAFRIIRTYLLVTALNFITVFESFSDSAKAFVGFIKNPLPHGLSLAYFLPKLSGYGVMVTLVVLLCCTLLFAVSLYEERHKNSGETICACHWIVQTITFIVLFAIVVLFSGNASGLSGVFMYAQF